MTQDDLRAALQAAGFEPWRAKQVYHWIYARGEGDPAAMANLPKPLRAWLAERAAQLPRLLRATGPEDGTRKALFELADGKLIESVLMRDGGVGRTSLCLSSQVGCAVGCTFCLTGFGGFQRNLTAGEIVSQVLEVRRRLMKPDEPLAHIVYMGMGEPMLNLDAVAASIRLLTDPDGGGLSRRRMTVSTSGIVPGIERFGAAELGVGLAVSLNATTDAIRERIMPINKKWPIAALLGALERFPLEQRRRVTIEYVLLRGVNDTPADADRLVKLLRGLRCKVNLIMFNPSPHLPFEPVPEAVLDHFARTLSREHYTVTVRWSKGRDLEAACGQLAAHYFEQPHA